MRYKQIIYSVFHLHMVTCWCELYVWLRLSIFLYVSCFWCMISYFICVKNIVIFYVKFIKNNSFLSFHSPFFHSKIHKHLACKMNTDKQGRSRSKIRSFEWTYFLNDPKVFFAATKIYILIFSLTHSLTSLIGSFHFLQWKIFFPIHW